MTKVIVVDDNRDNSFLIKTVLEMDGFEVAICPDLGRASQTATADTGAFIIDYYLAAGEVGLELLRRIRASETAAPAATPVIITSGDDRRRQEAYDAGADLFLLKPYGSTRLSEELRRLLAGEA